MGFAAPDDESRRGVSQVSLFKKTQRNSRQQRQKSHQPESLIFALEILTCVNADEPRNTTNNTIGFSALK